MAYETNGVTGSIDERDDVTPGDFWQNQLDIAENDVKQYRERADSVIDAYKDDDEHGARMMNILYSNTCVLKSSLLASSAIMKPDVRRRFANGTAAQRQAAIVLEKALSYYLDCKDPTEAIELGLFDALVPGTGLIRVQYEPDIVEIEQFRDEIDEEGEYTTVSETVETIADQSVYTQYHYWKDFLHEPARCWQDVTWIAFRHLMPREQLEDYFGEEVGKRIPLEGQIRAAETARTDSDDIPDVYKRAVVWEIWDKETKTRVWFAQGDREGVVREDEDPLGLENFFPMAEPLSFNREPDTGVPIPLYCTYQDQADELNVCVDKLHGLTESAKLRGIYDASIDVLSRWNSMEHEELAPVDSYALVQDKGGLNSVMEFQDLRSVNDCIQVLIQRKADLLQTIYDITGISDIMRAQSDPRETAKAQQLKGKFGSMRLQSMIKRVQKWVRDTIRIQAEIIAEHWTPEVLMRITGEQVTPEVMAILRDDKMRSYSIDIETEASVFEDAMSDRRERMEYLEAVNQIIPMAMQAAAQNPMMGLLYLDMIEFGSRGFKKSRQLEETFDGIRQQIMQQMQQPKQEKPDPEMMKVQAELQLQQQKQQAEQQLAQQRTQAELQLQQAKYAAEQANEMEKMRIKVQNDIRKLQVDAQMKNKEIDTRMIGELRQAEAEMALRIQELRMEAQLERENMRLEAQIKDKDSQRRTSAMKDRKLGGGL